MTVPTAEAHSSTAGVGGWPLLPRDNFRGGVFAIPLYLGGPAPVVPLMWEMWPHFSFKV